MSVGRRFNKRRRRSEGPIPFTIPALRTCRVYPFLPLYSLLNGPDCPASDQSDTGMNKNADEGTCAIPQ
jgi:hypothetical protein